MDRPPAPKYLLLVPLAWSLVTAPPALGSGIVTDLGMVLATVTTERRRGKRWAPREMRCGAGLLIWRDRTSAWQTVAAGLSSLR